MSISGDSFSLFAPEMELLVDREGRGGLQPVITRGASRDIVGMRGV